MSTKRKAISKMVRFEVFKRDRFSCQYCGAKAPDVILHLDHIRPVADGGENDILNLVTACAGCNSGKGARKLDDRSVVEKQRSQLDELEERRSQLEMMLQWRDEAESQKTDVVAEIAARMCDRGGFEPSESGRQEIRRWLKRFTVAEVLAALDEAFDHYMKWDGDAPIEDAFITAARKIPAIASLARQSAEKPYIGKLAYIQGILRKRLGNPRHNSITAMEEWLLVSKIPQAEALSLLERSAKRAETWQGFDDAVHEAQVQYWDRNKGSE